MSIFFIFDVCQSRRVSVMTSMNIFSQLKKRKKKELKKFRFCLLHCCDVRILASVKNMKKK